MYCYTCNTYIQKYYVHTYIHKTQVIFNSRRILKFIASCPPPPLLPLPMVISHVVVIMFCAIPNTHIYIHTCTYISITNLLYNQNRYHDGQIACFYIPYSGKVWRGKILANLANRLRFAKLKPSKFLIIIITLWL